jgi:hypothetical protein
MSGISDISDKTNTTYLDWGITFEALDEESDMFRKVFGFSDAMVYTGIYLNLLTASECFAFL